eukprot:10230976-Alexandrium_andersonii.AAC.1
MGFGASVVSDGPFAVRGTHISSAGAFSDQMRARRLQDALFGFGRLDNGTRTRAHSGRFKPL